MTDNAQPNDGWVLNVNVKQRDKRAFVAASRHVINETQDESELYPFMAQFIKVWPYAGDPTKPESYDELSVTEWNEAQNRVQAAFRLLANGPA